MNINIFDICREGTHVLGPGCRYVIWVQGCNRDCHGCITPESRDSKGGTLINSADLAADIILATHIDGITISGGEPFLQPEALTEMLALVRNRRPELTVIVYTGFTFEQLTTSPQCSELLQYIDVVIDGPYIDSLNDNKGIRGSSNQRIIPLTHRLDPYLAAMGQSPRHLQYVLNCDETVSKIGVQNK